MGGADVRILTPAIVAAVLAVAVLIVINNALVMVGRLSW